MDVDKTEYVATPLRKSHDIVAKFFFPFSDNPSTIKYNYQNVKHDRVRRDERRVAHVITPWSTMLSEFTTMR